MKTLRLALKIAKNRGWIYRDFTEVYGVAIRLKYKFFGIYKTKKPKLPYAI